MKLNLHRLEPKTYRGYLHIEESVKIPIDYESTLSSSLSNFILGYYVGSSFRLISSHRFLDDARLSAHRDAQIHPNREYVILFTSLSVYRVI